MDDTKNANSREMGLDSIEDFTQSLKLTVGLVKTHPNAKLPTKGSEEAAGYDLYSVEETVLKPGEIKLVSTGLKIALPPGYEAQVRPRSGMALKRGLTVLNSPGTIDPDYRGELGVILINHSKFIRILEPGDRIAQMVIQRVEQFIEMSFVESFDETDRGESGFGSTGQ